MTNTNTGATNMTEQVYTFEVFRPAYPQAGTVARVFHGTVERNRDSLNPATVYVRDFYAANDEDALDKGRQAAIAISPTVEFIAFDE